MTLEIVNVSNPRSLSPSSQFRAETYDKGNLTIDSTSSSVSSAIDTVIQTQEISYLTRTSVTPGSSSVGASNAKYTFNFTSPS